MTRAVACLLALAAALALAAPALAWTPPGATDQRGIERAALHLLRKPQRAQAVVRSIHVSTASKRWAMATLAAKPRFVDTFQTLLVLLLKVPRINGSFTWVVADFGNAWVGCGAAPLSVLRDLYGDRRPCVGAD